MEKRKVITLLVVVFLLLTSVVGCSKKNDIKLKAGEYTVEVKGMKPMTVR